MSFEETMFDEMSFCIMSVDKTLVNEMTFDEPSFDTELKILKVK
jgi:hypothetical protein